MAAPNSNPEEKSAKELHTKFADIYPLSTTSKNMSVCKLYKAECHWLIKDLVLIGEYPLSVHYVDYLIQEIGVTTFICMVDLKHEVKRYGGLTNYWDKWIMKNKNYKNTNMELLTSPISDFSVSDDKTMSDFLIQIVKHITSNNHKIYYMHCMTGHGRTGLISVLLLMCLYKIEWNTALDLLKKYHTNRDCKNGKYFYNSCSHAMSIKADTFDPKKYGLQTYYPMPQESSQFRQIQKLQKSMHQIHDFYQN